MIRAVVFALLVTPIAVNASYCDNFQALTKRAAELRQKAVKIDHEPTNLIERDMLNNLFQFPGFRTDVEQRKAVLRFTNNWNEACRAGWYN